MEKEEQNDIRKLIEEGHEIPDLAVDLDRILVPLACQNFEKFGVEVAKQIAREYGASVTLLHNGSGNLDKWAIPFEEFKLDVTKIHTREDHSKTPDLIVEEAKNNYQLMIMPSRRRLKWIDKFFINSISDKVIDRVPYDVLQVFPGRGGMARDEEKIPEFNNIGILLPRAQRDPRLLFWGNSLLQKKGSKLTAYHIADLPRLTPMKVALDTKVVTEEHNDFTSLVNAYSQLLSTEIEPRFLVSHKIALTASNVLNKDQPDIAVMGQTKEKHWWQIRTLSDKILDTAEVPFIVHHLPV